MGNSIDDESRVKGPGFFGSIWESWLSFMSGILSVILFAVAAVGEPFSWSVPIRLSFFILGVIALYGASYSVWRRERQRVNDLADQLRKRTELAASRKQIREAIGQILANGNQLMATIHDRDPLPIQEAQDWIDNSADEIAKLLDESYVARFHSPAGTGGLDLKPDPKNRLLASINFRLMRLNQFLAELTERN